ncbi:MAG: hypothetical protein INR65_18535, partial [Gluconacetobacter diazotrophicus]|nr:hypothetical protein [Gluconacetobacter diazotrophicus]
MNEDHQGKLELRSTRRERADRLLSAGEVAAHEDPASILYQHTVMCQTGLPYRDPGADVLRWERINGHVHMAMRAGEAMHPTRGRLVQIGLPFG